MRGYKNANHNAYLCGIIVNNLYETDEQHVSDADKLTGERITSR